MSRDSLSTEYAHLTPLLISSSMTVPNILVASWSLHLSALLRALPLTSMSTRSMQSRTTFRATTEHNTPSTTESKATSCITCRKQLSATEIMPISKDFFYSIIKQVIVSPVNDVIHLSNTLLYKSSAISAESSVIGMRSNGLSGRKISTTTSKSSDLRISVYIISY